MFVEDWDSFYQQAENLYQSNPLSTRYVMKYTHSSGKLVLKVTDDRVCLQYATDQIADLKKIEKLNNKFFRIMATGQDSADTDMVDQPASSVAQTMPSPMKHKKGKQK